jgi:hypothetical protein
MSNLLDDLNVFLREHRRCGKMDGDVEGERVWMACDGCGAGLARSWGRVEELGRPKEAER